MASSCAPLGSVARFFLLHHPTSASPVRRPFNEHGVTNRQECRPKEKADESERHSATDYTKENQDKRHVAAASSDQKRAEEAIEVTHDQHPNCDKDRPFDGPVTVKPKNRKHRHNQRPPGKRGYDENQKR